MTYPHYFTWDYDAEGRFDLDRMELEEANDGSWLRETWKDDYDWYHEDWYDEED